MVSMLLQMVIIIASLLQLCSCWQWFIFFIKSSQHCLGLLCRPLLPVGLCHQSGGRYSLSLPMHSCHDFRNDLMMMEALDTILCSNINCLHITIDEHFLNQESWNTCMTMTHIAIFYFAGIFFFLFWYYTIFPH